MRNKYSKEFESEMIKKAPNKTLEELLKIAKKKYNYQISKTALRKYLSKRKIRYKGYNANRICINGALPIGSEYTKPDGMTLVKVRSDKWEYKQRYLYEKYHNVELPTSTMVVFLDEDRTNFNIDNLMAVSTPEYLCIRNKKLLSNNAKLNETAFLSARVIYKTKEVRR